MLTSRHSGIGRVNEDYTALPATHTFIHKWPAFNPSRTASP